MFSPETEAEFDRLTAQYPEKRSALVPILLAAQREHGWIKPAVVEYVAGRLGLSSSDVESVVSFYTLLNRSEVGQNLLLVCTNISCMLCGSDDIERALRNRLSIGWGETTPDGRFTLIEAECLGSCTTAPVLQVNGKFHENLTVASVEALLDDLQSTRAEHPSDSHDRHDAQGESPSAS
jgi:NADH-quinone oxidoreductase subunit E